MSNHFCACVIVATAFFIHTGSALQPADCVSAPIKTLVYPIAPYAFGKEVLNSTLTRHPPLEGIMYEWFHALLHRCVALCKDKVEVYWKVVKSEKEFIAEFVNQSNGFQYGLPISTALEMVMEKDAAARQVSPFFATVVNPNAYFVIVDRENVNRKAEQKMLSTLGESWPVFLLAFLLAGISGIVMWILEVSSNKEEFPPFFPRGSYEGFWWAFITMTTVGYGDKTPRSVAGRLFGVVWILLGLVVIAMYTATVTDVFLSLSHPDFVMRHKTLAVVQAAGDGAYEEVGYLRCFAKSTAFINLHASTDYSTFADAYKDLKADKVDGIFIDKVQGAYYMNKINDEELRIMKTISSHSVHFQLLVKRSIPVFPTAFECFESPLQHPHIAIFVKKFAPPGQTYFASEDSQTFLTIQSRTLRMMLSVLAGLLCTLVIAGIIAQRFCSKAFCFKMHSEKGNTINNKVKVQPLDQKGSDLTAIGIAIQDMSKEFNKLRDLVNKTREGAVYHS